MRIPFILSILEHCCVSTLRDGMGSILGSCLQHGHRHAHTHVHTHIETRNQSCIGRGWCCHSHGDLTYRCRGDTNQREKPYCVCACVCMCVRLWLWQKLELEEEKEEEEKEGLQEFTLCLACLRFMPHSFTTLYQGKYWTSPFNYQGSKFSMALLLKEQASALLGKAWAYGKEEAAWQLICMH